MPLSALFARDPSLAGRLEAPRAPRWPTVMAALAAALCCAAQTLRAPTTAPPAPTVPLVEAARCAAQRGHPCTRVWSPDRSTPTPAPVAVAVGRAALLLSRETGAGRGARTMAWLGAFLWALSGALAAWLAAGMAPRRTAWRSPLFAVLGGAGFTLARGLSPAVVAAPLLTLLVGALWAGDREDDPDAAGGWRWAPVAGVLAGLLCQCGVGFAWALPVVLWRGARVWRRDRRALLTGGACCALALLPVLRWGWGDVGGVDLAGVVSRLPALGARVVSGFGPVVLVLWGAGLLSPPADPRAVSAGRAWLGMGACVALGVVLTPGSSPDALIAFAPLAGVWAALRLEALSDRGPSGLGKAVWTALAVLPGLWALATTPEAVGNEPRITATLRASEPALLSRLRAGDGVLAASDPARAAYWLDVPTCPLPGDAAEWALWDARLPAPIAGVLLFPDVSERESPWRTVHAQVAALWQTLRGLSAPDQDALRRLAGLRYPRALSVPASPFAPRQVQEEPQGGVSVVFWDARFLATP